MLSIQESDMLLIKGAQHQVEYFTQPAPEARQKVARGERVARHPWKISQNLPRAEGAPSLLRPLHSCILLSPFSGLDLQITRIPRGGAQRARPWLPSDAPSALVDRISRAEN